MLIEAGLRGLILQRSSKSRRLTTLQSGRKEGKKEGRKEFTTFAADLPLKSLLQAPLTPLGRSMTKG